MAWQRSKSSPSNRRQFFQNSVRWLGGVCLSVATLSVITKNAAASPATALRPPGAKKNLEFLASCVRCGLCVRDCPYDTLKLADLFDDVTLGTPYFEARQVPCEMCDDIPCVAACPTGALDPELRDINQARMGLAVLIDHETCLNMQGLRCDVCYRVCPLIDEAITLDMVRNTRTGKHAIFKPTVHSDMCTGCGKCEHACVLEESAIKVLPHHIAKGELGAHYRWGWKEKEKAGKALIDNVLDLPDRRPEAVQ